MALKPKHYIMEKMIPLDRETVWQLLSETDVLNRFIGLFPAKFGAAEKVDDDVFFRHADAKVFGFVPLSWDESPFQWVKYQHYSVERHYLTGPLKHFVGGIELADAEASLQNGHPATIVRLVSTFTPRNVLGLFAIPVNGLTSMKKTYTYLEKYIEKASIRKDAMPIQFMTSAPIKPSKEFNRIIDQLKKMPISLKLIDKLGDYILTRPEYDLGEIRPYELSKEWEMDRDHVLKIFLYATKAGLFNLNWNLICPNCRISKKGHTSLSGLDSKFHCDLCGIDYEANFDRYVELTFSVHPSIRKSYANTYCVGGPSLSPHVQVQMVVKARRSVQFPIPHSDAPRRLRVLQANDIVPVLEGPSGDQDIIYSDTGWCSNTLNINQSQTCITVFNDSSESRVIVLEKTDWSKERVTASEVTAMQEFRDLFSSEVLAPGQQVAIENVTILFSDLRGSTSLYESVGDASAYGRVRKHFDFLKEHIGMNQGSIVKTIGDAVMAVFSKPEDGLKASLSIQKNIATFNRETSTDMVLKIGFFTGPVIAVNSNDLLDYFGRTVNMAARIQAQSRGGDLVLSQEDWKKEAIKALLSEQDIHEEAFSTVLKGINGTYPLVRLKIN